MQHMRVRRLSIPCASASKQLSSTIHMPRHRSTMHVRKPAATAPCMRMPASSHVSTPVITPASPGHTMQRHEGRHVPKHLQQFAARLLPFCNRQYHHQHPCSSSRDTCLAATHTLEDVIITTAAAAAAALQCTQANSAQTRSLLLKIVHPPASQQAASRHLKTTQHIECSRLCCCIPSTQRRSSPSSALATICHKHQHKHKICAEGSDRSTFSICG